MSLDFNGASEQTSFELIPAGTVCSVHMTVRPGSAGEGGWLKRSKDGGCEMIDAEFVVLDGQYAKRKFWSSMVVDGTTEGHKTAAQISGGKIRAILESARGVSPSATDAAATAARKIAGWGDLDGLRFVTKVDVEKGTGGYKDKNVLGEVQTPDKKGWTKVEQVAKAAAPPAAVVASNATSPIGITKPAWAS